MFYLSHQCQMCMFSFLDRIFKFSGKKSLLHRLFHELGTDTDLDRPNPDWHALDADPDPAKCSGSDPIRLSRDRIQTSLGSNPDIYQKCKMGDIRKGKTNTL
jgi:hypothetical protein